MPTYRHGRHEHGQNFLTDTSIISRITQLVAATTGPIIEIGPGEGALTAPLERLRRPLTAVEIDPRLATALTERMPKHVEIVTGDFLDYRLPQHPHVIVGNLPFHQTTAMLRRILRAPAWSDAILLTQWEVARRRAGVGASTMMTAQWSPWFEFELHGRVPARAFIPRPGVDGGILALRRIHQPVLRTSDRGRFQALVHRVYTGPGRGMAQILPRTTALASARAARAWLAAHGLPPDALPGALGTEAWIDLFIRYGAAAGAARRRSTR